MIAAIISAVMTLFISGYLIVQRNNKQKHKKRFDAAADEYFKSIGVHQKKDKNGNV